MPADINAYALGLELQLQADKAFQTLEKFKDQLSGVEKALTIAPNSFNVTGIKQATGVTRGLGVEAQFVDSVYLKIVGTFLEYQKVLDNINEGSGLLTKSTEAQIENFVKLKAEIEPMVKLIKNLDLSKAFSPDRAKLIQTGVQRFEKLGEALNYTVKASKAQTETFKSVVSALDMAGDSGKILSSTIIDLVLGATKAGIAFEFLRRGVADVIAMQDAYAPITMRVLGTQNDLIKASNDLRTSLGATADESVATFKSLADAGFRANEAIGEMAKTNFMFSQATGVSSSQTASFQRAVFTTNRDARQTTVAVSEMSAAIRNSGMSAQEAASLMDGLTKALRPLRFIYGEKDALAMSKGITQIAAAARMAGGDSSALAQDLIALARSPVKLITAFGVAGKSLNNFKDINIGDFADAAAAKLTAFASQGPLVAEAMAPVFQMSLEGADALKQLWLAADQNKQKFKELITAQTSNADVEADFNLAMQTFTKSLKQVVQPLLALGSVLMDTIVPAITTILKPIVFVAQAIATLANAIGKVPVLGTILKAAFGTALLVMVTSKLLGFTNVLHNAINVAKNAPSVFNALWHSLGREGTIKSLANKEILGWIKNQLLGQQVSRVGAKVITQEGASIAATVKRLRELRGATASAGEGMGLMGGGALQAVMGLAKAHPIIAAVIAIIGAALIVVPKLFEMFDSGDKKTRALGAALMVIMWPLVQVYTTLKLLWAVVKGVWEAISDALSEAFEPLVEAFDDIFGKGENAVKITEVFARAMDVVTVGVKSFLKFIAPGIWLIKAFGFAMKGILNLVMSPIQTLTNLWDKLVLAIKNPAWAIGAAWKYATDAIKNSWNNAVKSMKDAWKSFMNLFRNTDDGVKKTTEDIRTAHEKMWGVKEHNNASRAHRAVTNFGKALHQVASPEVTKAVDRAYSKAGAAAEPLVKPITGRLTQPTDTSSAKTHVLLTACKDAMTTMSTKLDGVSQDEVVTLLKQYFPQLVEKNKRSGLGQTAANQWM